MALDMGEWSLLLHAGDRWKNCTWSYQIGKVQLLNGAISSLDAGCYVLSETNSSSQSYREVSRHAINHSDRSDFGLRCVFSYCPAGMIRVTVKRSVALGIFI
jgi:hypothetical protein